MTKIAYGEDCVFSSWVGDYPSLTFTSSQHGLVPILGSITRNTLHGNANFCINENVWL